MEQKSDEKKNSLSSGISVHAFHGGLLEWKRDSKYNIEYLNKDKTGIAEMPYDASAATTDALIEEFFAALSSDPDMWNTVNQSQMMWRSQIFVGRSTSHDLF